MSNQHEEDPSPTGVRPPQGAGWGPQSAHQPAGPQPPGEHYWGPQSSEQQPYGHQTHGHQTHQGPADDPQRTPYPAPGYPPQHPPPYPAPYPTPTFGQPPQAPLPDAPQGVWVPPVPVYPYASWARRVGAWLIDFAPSLIAQIPFWIGYVMLYVRLIRLSAAAGTIDPDEVLAGLTGAPLVWMAIGFVLALLAFAWQWYNRWLVAGRTGQSLGKRMLNTKLVAEINGQPVGPVNAFLRDLLHVLDGAAYIGYLWPLWDAKRQTFSDMIMKTVVIDQRAQPGVGQQGADQQLAADHSQAPHGAA